MYVLCQLQLQHMTRACIKITLYVVRQRRHLRQHAHRIRQEIRGGFRASTRRLLRRLPLLLLLLLLHARRRLCGLRRYKQRRVHLRRVSEIKARKCG